MQLFVDMDGVLADFDKGYKLRFGVETSKEIDNVDWALVRETEGFFRDLPPMEDFDILWSGLSHLNPVILTGVPRSVTDAKSNKREWIDKNIGTDQPMIGCPSKDKSLYIKNKGDILIDDWERYKALWIKRGGNWITHKSAKQSLEELYKILGN